MSRVPGQTSPAELHSAGAIVRHRSPFSELEVPIAEQPIAREVIETWVKPFYVLDIGDVAAADAAIGPVAGRIDERLVSELLAHFDWRPRIVAAHLAAVRNLRGNLDLIGRLLVRSDVCDAGRGYCVALAAFNTPEAREYLYRYLEYYLTRPELWFDQADALADVLVDEGASRALAGGKGSLLPVGVLGVRGEFRAGDAIRVVGADGAEIARGLARLSSADVARVAGRKGEDLSALSGGAREVVVVHRDDLVVTAGRR